MVRVTVPGGHLNNGMKGKVISRITRVLAEIDEHPQRLYQEPHAWVQIVELPNGNVGAFGQIMRLADIVKMVVDPAHKVA